MDDGEDASRVAHGIVQNAGHGPWTPAIAKDSGVVEESDDLAVAAVLEGDFECTGASPAIVHVLEGQNGGRDVGQELEAQQADEELDDMHPDFFLVGVGLIEKMIVKDQRIGLYR